MQFQLEQNQIAQPIDDATRAALEAARAQVARGEVYTLTEVRQHLKERSKAWRKTQEPVLSA